MKTSNLCMTLFAALAITACSEENEFPQESESQPPGRIYLYRDKYSSYDYDESPFGPCH